MKKLLVLLSFTVACLLASAEVVNVEFVARDASAGYGYRQYQLPIGFTFMPWSLPNFESSVYGLRLDLGWGSYAETYGIEGGLFCRSGDFGGIAAPLIANCTSHTAGGLLVAAVNYSKGDVYGVQIGAVNIAERLHGVQIGFLNFNGSGITLPIINAGF